MPPARAPARGVDGDPPDLETELDVGESNLETELKLPGRPPAHLAYNLKEKMRLVRGHESKPLTVFKDGLILLETWNPFFAVAEEFCVAIAEPVARPEAVHEYQITSLSLYGGVTSSGLKVEQVIELLKRLSKTEIDKRLAQWIKESAENLGKVKYLMAKPGEAGGADAALHSHHYLESADYQALQKLEEILQEREAQDSVRLITEVLPPLVVEEGPDAKRRRVGPTLAGFDLGDSVRDGTVDILEEGVIGGGTGAAGAHGGELGGVTSSISGGAGAAASSAAEVVNPAGEGPSAATARRTNPDGQPQTWTIRVDASKIEVIKKTSHDHHVPLIEEYAYRDDDKTPPLEIAIRASTEVRDYQSTALSKMLSGGRARSGIIVLPCGAGKTLVGIAAAATVKKRTLVLTSTAMAVSQWRNQFLLFSNIAKEDIFVLTAESKSEIKDQHEACVVISTYSMIGFGGRRGAQSQFVMNQIKGLEWGLLVCDEVQVMPAKTFRQVSNEVHSRCKLGLTATLVREDDLIEDLQWLIGPKLYEANWFALEDLGYLATVQCVEVWAEMSKNFYDEYLKALDRRAGHACARLLYTCNPVKLCIAEYLIRLHEKRGDKILVFSDNTDILVSFAKAMERHFIYGKVGNRERELILRKFKEDPNISTIFLSKVGDNAIDLPNANVIIQINSHFASRRQEAQRLGRILRPKRSAAAGAPALDPASAARAERLRHAQELRNLQSVEATSHYCPHGGGSSHEEELFQKSAQRRAQKPRQVNAFFYSLVSRDTQEMYYATKRQQFLVEQGYDYKIVEGLYDRVISSSKDADLIYKGKGAEQKLLEFVLARTGTGEGGGGLYEDEVEEELDFQLGEEEAEMGDDGEWDTGGIGGVAGRAGGAPIFKQEEGWSSLGELAGGNSGVFFDDE